MNRIQNIRKTNGFDITDKIEVSLESNAETDVAVEEYKDYIARQVLADKVTVASGVLEGEGTTELDFDTFKLNVKIIKSGR